ncbi:MAG TPA: GldG family protein [Candidatus Limnocylindrales bacterium]|jgi:hypothetical protein|nr:GldG family protein [Candidatus Limnocylindrales bacterium]
MADPTPEKSTFSPYRKWGIGLQVCLVIGLVLSVVVMINYLSHDYFFRYHLSARGRIPLATRTVKFLESVTNDVNVTIYYDKNDPLYTMVADLLKEYKRINRKINVQTVDYLRDAGAAVQLKQKYTFLASPNAKDIILFDCGGRYKTVNGNAIAQYVTERMPNEKEIEYRRKLVSFTGEKAFTSAVIWVTNPKQFKACFLQGDGEHDIESGDETLGYLKLAAVLLENSIQAEKISLLGTNEIPADCNLLVIAGPTVAIPDPVLDKVDQYLNQGGRLLALFNFSSIHKETGLERILAKWGVSVGTNTIQDLQNTKAGTDVIVTSFADHPVVAPLQTLALQLILPRPIGKLQSARQSADAPRVQEIAFTGSHATIDKNPQLGSGRFPLMVAVEKGALKDVITDRGTTRMVVIGDSIFLVNRQIESGANKDLAGYAVNWLLDRPHLLEGLEPRPVAEYRLVMTNTQLQSAEWLLLAGMPGAVLALGSVVWLRRRG